MSYKEGVRLIHGKLLVTLVVKISLTKFEVLSTKEGYGPNESVKK